MTVSPGMNDGRNAEVNTLLTELTTVLADALGSRATDDGAAWLPPMKLVEDLIAAEDKVIRLANLARDYARERGPA